MTLLQKSPLCHSELLLPYSKLLPIILSSSLVIPDSFSVVLNEAKNLLLLKPYRSFAPPAGGTQDDRDQASIAKTRKAFAVVVSANSSTDIPLISAALFATSIT